MPPFEQSEGTLYFMGEDGVPIPFSGIHEVKFETGDWKESDFDPIDFGLHDFILTGTIELTHKQVREMMKMLNRARNHDRRIWRSVKRFKERMRRERLKKFGHQPTTN